MKTLIVVVITAAVIVAYSFAQFAIELSKKMDEHQQAIHNASR